MGIDYRRPEYEASQPRWQLIDDMCDEVNLGDHLPNLNPNDESPENVTRNDQYKERASFFGASRITLQSLVGTAFEDDPMISLPSDLEYMLKNVDGGGADIWQQMQSVTGQVLRKARCGLFVTMPTTEGATSRADQEAGRVISTIHEIDAHRIINWWSRRDGAEIILGGVVFTDTRETVEDYEIKVQPTRRELAIDGDGFFFDRTWVKTKDRDEWVPEEAIYPVQGNGQKWRRIPFLFVGSERNSWAMQTPPMLSLARLNRDHYRNSADHEESLWYAGQAQPYIEPDSAGSLRQDDLAAAKKEGFYVGSRQVILGKFGFAQAEANTGVRQALIDKQEQMAALGARFVQPGSAVKTATQAGGEAKIQHSVLSLASVNVEDAYQWACEQAAIYMNANPGEVEIKLHRAFMDPEVTAERMREIRENVLSGLAPLEVMFRALQRAGDIPAEKSFDEYREEVAATGFGVTENADDA